MKITEHVHAIKIPFHIPVAPGKVLKRFVYSYLIFGSEICLIDSGVMSSDRIIYDYIKETGSSHNDISLLILTHAHPDHIGSAKAIKESAKCVVAAHENAKPWIEDVDLQFKERPVPGFHSLVEGSVQIDRFLHAGESIDLEHDSLEIIHTPGHSKGSISLFCKKSGVLFTGDAIPQWSDLPIYDDVSASIESINKFKNIPNIKWLLGSWADPKKGEQAYKMIDDGLDYLQGIHNAIIEISDKNVLNDPMELCKQMVAKLKLPEIAINPIVAKSFASHLKILNQKKLGANQS